MQNGAADAAHIRLTHFQFGMLRNAAAEALLAMGFASLPGEVVNLVVRLEVPPYTVVDAGMPEASKAPSSVQKQPPPFLTRSRPSSGVRRHSRTARSSSGSSAVVSSLHDFDVSTFVPSPQLHVKSGSHSACASSAWLAPDSTIEVGDGGYVKAQSVDMEIAPPPDGLHTLRCR